MTVKRTLAGCALLLLPLSARTQSIHGVVVDRSDQPVAGVVVFLVDSVSSIAARALTNERGGFRVSATRAGTFQVRFMRIGFQPVTSERMSLATGADVVRRFVLTGVVLSLDTIHVVSRNVCRAFTDSAAATFLVWNQIRTALTATQLTGHDRRIALTTLMYERTLEPDGRRVRAQQFRLHSGDATQPWRSLAPDSLHRIGYVVTDSDNSTIYYAPGLDGLLSNEFVEDHCFRLISDRDRLGIEFEPAPDRKRIAEIRGVMWIARASAELRSMSLRYVNVTSYQEQEAGAEMEFVRMTNGTWTISRWGIRMPVLEQRLRASALGGNDIHVAEIRVAGGEVVLARNGADTVWAQPPRVLSGRLVDSTTGTAVGGARIALVGTQLAATSDERGRFAIAGVLPGEYAVEVRTPSLDSVRAVHQSSVSFTDAAAPHEIRVPKAQQVISRQPSAATFTGRVLTDSTKQPIAGAEVALPGLARSVVTNERGTFRIEDIPDGTHQVTVRHMGYGALDTPVRFSSNQTVDREILLTRTVVLDTVATKESATIPSFEENRRMGLGSFLTRDQLAKQEGRKLSDVLAGLRGVVIQQGRGNHGWIASKRLPATLDGSGLYVPERFEQLQGLKAGCYARVYLDNMLMNPERPTRPFDVNTIAPEQIEAVEFYAGPSETPVKYSKLNADCGVLQLWTKR